eukprot:scaffold75404_cov30-Prasinocladus_malaysianus.AAC.1
MGQLSRYGQTKHEQIRLENQEHRPVRLAEMKHFHRPNGLQRFVCLDYQRMSSKQRYLFPYAVVSSRASSPGLAAKFECARGVWLRVKQVHINA